MDRIKRITALEVPFEMSSFTPDLRSYRNEVNTISQGRSNLNRDSTERLGGSDGEAHRIPV
jgi:hypothetical protein